MHTPGINTQSLGFTEAGIATTQAEDWLALLCQTGHWQEAWAGQTPPGVLQLWGQEASTLIPERLLIRPGQELGFIRLFDVSQLPACVSQKIRPDACTWDSGGIFDLDLRVGRMEPFQTSLLQKGWRGVSPQPVDWKFGQLEVREWLLRGPDDVIFALIERLAPPLEELQGMQGFGHAFNSSQIVRDMAESIRFYRALGFELLVDFSGALEGHGGEVLGLPPEQAPHVPVRLVIMQPRGEMSGSVELVSFENAGAMHQGRDFSAQALPCNQGLNLLRFPAGNLDQLIKQAGEQGYAPTGAVITSRLEPWGTVRIAALTSPDGAWLEFYECQGWGNTG